MAASFYASPQLGAISTFATFCHEIPHEIADYSILIKSGFTKRQAMGSQFLTAVGAFVGTFLGIIIAESAGATGGSVSGSHSDKGIDLAAVVLGRGKGFFGTSVTGADLVIPATAGGFLYIASVSVIPDLLAESKSLRQTIKEVSKKTVSRIVFNFGLTIIPPRPVSIRYFFPTVRIHDLWRFRHGLLGLERVGNRHTWASKFRLNAFIIHVAQLLLTMLDGRLFPRYTISKIRMRISCTAALSFIACPTGSRLGLGTSFFLLTSLPFSSLTISNSQPSAPPFRGHITVS